ncbi:MAG: hypothetical protein M1831_001855 [Alyxoria varia]|nr:MAG: hypothetical protein M1831_001855 [Alyxoria varia]
MSASDNLLSTSQVPLVKTCQTCAKAKLKCYRSKRSDACDRCLRMHKECYYRPALRQNNATRSDPRIESLQSEVGSLKDQLQQLLTDPKASSSGADSSIGTGEDESNPRGSLSGTSAARFSPSSHHITQGSSLMPEGLVDASDDVISSGVLSMDLADHLLSVYKESMVPHFPFIPVEQDVTAIHLRTAKPFLFLAIVTVACFDDMSLQKLLCKFVKDAISSRMIQNGEISFEILQGLLVYLAWSQYHPRPLRFTQYLSLALSIAVDLRLDRPSSSSTWKNRVMLDSEDVTQLIINSEDTTHPAFNRASWGTDDLRVVTGLFYLSSSTSLLMQKFNQFQHSAYIDCCAERLSRHPEYPNDKFITHIVRLQHLQEKINESSILRSQGPKLDSASTEMSVTRWKSDLELFRDRLPFHLTDSDLLNMQYRSTELHLYQIHILLDHPVSSIPKPSSNQSPTSNPPPTSATQAWPPWRVDILKDGFISAKSLLDLYTGLPLGSEKHFNNPETVQIALALTAASKFYIVAATAAGKSVREETLAIRKALDLPGILERVVQRLRALEGEDSQEKEYKDVFYYFEKRVERIARWFGSRFHAVTGEPRMSETADVSHGKKMMGETSDRSPDDGRGAQRPGDSYRVGDHPDLQEQRQPPMEAMTHRDSSSLPPDRHPPQSTLGPTEDPTSLHNPQLIQNYPMMQYHSQPQSSTFSYPEGPYPVHNTGFPMPTTPQQDIPITDVEMADMLDPAALDQMMRQFMDYPMQMQMTGGNDAAGGMNNGGAGGELADGANGGGGGYYGASGGNGGSAWGMREGSGWS